MLCGLHTPTMRMLKMSHAGGAPQVPKCRTNLDALPLIGIRLLSRLFAVMP